MNLEIKEPILYKLVNSVVSTMSSHYPELKEKQQYIEQTILSEENAFLRTLEKGVMQFERIVENTSSDKIKGKDAFKLYDTYGFPLDLTEMMAEEINKKVFEVKKLNTENNELYGSVKPTEIAKLIKEICKVEVKPSIIQPVQEIKALGKFKVTISLHSAVDAEIIIEVQSAETIQ